MITFVGVLITLLLVLVMLLAIPLTLYFKISWPKSSENALDLRWLFGVVRVRLPIQEIGSKSVRKTRAKRQSAKKASSKILALAGRAPVEPSELVLTLLRLGRRTWHSIEKNDVKVWLRVGLGDPADTGMLWATIWPLAAVFPRHTWISVELVPEFTESVIELQSSGSLRFAPLQLVALVIRVIATPTVWRSFR